MKNVAMNKRLGTYVVATTVAVCLFVSPWNSIDPVNLPKMVLLGILASIIFSMCLNRDSLRTLMKNKNFFIVFSALVFFLFLNVTVGTAGIELKLYGTPGRNTGILTYVSLCVVTLAATISSSIQILKRFSLALVLTGSLLSIYGIFQWQGLDIFDYVNSYGTNVFGTFGNPNFQSAFMGIVAAVAFVWAVLGGIKLRFKISLYILVFLAILNIKLSSEQGYLNFIVGITAAFVIYFFSIKKKKCAWALIFSSIMGGVLLIAGIFNAGPLANVIYKSSLQARGFYWRGAINMIMDHPILGVGLDRYGDWYRRSRSQSVASFNPNLVADSAHSIPLDLGASGGFPLLIVYLLLVILVLISISKVVKRSSEFDVIFTALVSGWFAYQAQSLISINQIGLGVWGWALTGIIIGYEISNRDQNEFQPKNKATINLRNSEKNFSSYILVGIFSAFVGFALFLPPYLSANKYYEALKSQDANKIISATYLFPADRSKYFYTTQILLENKMEGEAIKVLENASLKFSDSFDLWKQWSQIPGATSAQVAKAKSEMKRLDPFNPELK